MSWYGLLDIYRQAAAERQFWRSQRPRACPNDGEPLLPSPPGAGSELFCRFDGWKYPQDWNPDTMAGM